MIPLNQITLEQPYFVRVKRSGKLAIATAYGVPGAIDRTKATDQNCFTQYATDYEWIQAVEVPAAVLDELSTARIDAVAEVERSEVTR